MKAKTKDPPTRDHGVREIAKLSHVSIGTVDRALHGRDGIREKTRRRILRVAERIGYTPNPVARALSVRRTGLRIGVCVPHESHFFYDQIRAGLTDGARKSAHFGVEILDQPIQGLESDASQQIRDLLCREVRALILTPGNPDTFTPLIDEAESMNVRVICVASDAPASSRSALVSVDPENSGRLAAELMGKLWIPRSEVAIITGGLHTEDHRRKVQSFSEQFPRFCPGGKVIDVIEGHGDEEETFHRCVELLRNRKALAGLYVSITNCLPVCRALVASRLAGKIKLITTDFFKQMTPYFQNGAIFASIHQNPYVQGQYAVQLAVEHLVKGRTFPSVHFVNPAIIMLSNLHIFSDTSQQGAPVEHVKAGRFTDTRPKSGVSHL